MDSRLRGNDEDLGAEIVRTRLSICRKKASYASDADAISATTTANIPLRHYRCDRCHAFHLTSRTKGKRIPRPLG
jgi:uncharacterized protein YlaI